MRSRSVRMNLAGAVITMCAAALLSLGLFAGLARPAFGQGANQGSIQGTLTDPSGAVVPSATLTATNAATGIAFTTSSDANGLYTFLVVPARSEERRVGKEW